MEGLSYLLSISEEQKEKINSEFGSIENLYKQVFELSNDEYTLFTSKPIKYQQKIQIIKNKLDDIESKLDEIGLDGQDITSEISNDHSEIIVERHITILDKELNKFGTDFMTIRQWLKDNYKI